MLTLFLILLPLAVSPFFLLLKRENGIRWLALAGALAEFALAVAAFIQYKYGCRCNLLFSSDILVQAGISLKFGIDGLSLLMVMLTAFLVPVIIASSFGRPIHRPGAFYALIFLMETALVGVFTTFDGLVFYVFWEMALIPAWFISALWGGEDRIRITFKFFIYTFTGSLFMLVALVWLFFRTPLPHSFDFRWLYAVRLSPSEASWIFLAFFVAFAIKIPVFPFHSWQPDTYTVAPPAGSMLLAGIMLKMGLYGMIRWMIPVCPSAVREWAHPAMILAIAGIVYGSLIALRQNDLKRLVAWSSIAHVGLMAAGLLAMNARATEGTVIQMVSHGITVTGLFIVAGLIEHRTGTRQITELGGIALKAPRLAVFFMIILLGSIALPLTSGFVGEFMILLGLFEFSPAFAAVAGLTIIFGAVYMLWMYQRVMLGPANPVTEDIQDLSPREMAILLPLVIMIFWIGLYPSFFLSLITGGTGG